ncbi:MAG: hypothetical protein LLF94_08255 [Chlamydiales bacterium]|nr:hypothetical protein [Chlamydiales bacterium]
MEAVLGCLRTVYYTLTCQSYIEPKELYVEPPRGTLLKYLSKLGDECAICTEGFIREDYIVQKTHGVAKKILFTTCCNNFYHTGCLQEISDYARKTLKVNPPCPTCREEFAIEDHKKSWNQYLTRVHSVVVANLGQEPEVIQANLEKFEEEKDKEVARKLAEQDLREELVNQKRREIQVKHDAQLAARLAVQ